MLSATNHLSIQYSIAKCFLTDVEAETIRVIFSPLITARVKLPPTSSLIINLLNEKLILLCV
jgi:hypothetical protein